MCQLMKEDRNFIFSTLYLMQTKQNISTLSLLKILPGGGWVCPTMNIIDKKYLLNINCIIAVIKSESHGFELSSVGQDTGVTDQDSDEHLDLSPIEKVTIIYIYI